jgi:hypothetical protein
MRCHIFPSVLHDESYDPPDAAAGSERDVISYGIRKATPRRSLPLHRARVSAPRGTSSKLSRTFGRMMTLRFATQRCLSTWALRARATIGAWVMRSAAPNPRISIYRKGMIRADCGKVVGILTIGRLRGIRAQYGDASRSTQCRRVRGRAGRSSSEYGGAAEPEKALRAPFRGVLGAAVPMNHKTPRCDPIVPTLADYIDASMRP